MWNTMAHVRTIYKLLLYITNIYIIHVYIPRKIRDRTTSEHSHMLDSAICEHLNAINTSTANYYDECFAVLYKAMSKQHLNAPKAIYILFNRPSLSKQNTKHSLRLLGDVSGVT